MASEVEMDLSKYALGYKESASKFKITGTPNLDVTKLPKVVNGRLHLDYIGYYLFPIYTEEDIDEIPLHTFLNATMPKFKNGEHCLYYQLNHAKLDWNTVNWKDPKNPLEGPPVSKENYPDEGRWKRDDKGWWEIHFKNGKKFVPSWPYKLKKLGKDEIHSDYETVGNC